MKIKKIQKKQNGKYEITLDDNLKIKTYDEIILNNDILFSKELNDEEILLYALEGKLGSSTKQPNRGRGLPQLRHMVEKKWISDFVLITNRVSLRYINDNFVIKQHPNFVGTYYYWTINKENYTVWKRK